MRAKRYREKCLQRARERNPIFKLERPFDVEIAPILFIPGENDKSIKSFDGPAEIFFNGVKFGDVDNITVTGLRLSGDSLDC